MPGKRKVKKQCKDAAHKGKNYENKSLMGPMGKWVWLLAVIVAIVGNMLLLITHLGFISLRLHTFSYLIFT